MIFGFHKKFVPGVLSGDKKYSIRGGYRFKEGMKLHFYYGPYLPGRRIRFAESICESVNNIDIWITTDFKSPKVKTCGITINGKDLKLKQAKGLAKKDGFDTLVEFMRYFFPHTSSKKYGHNKHMTIETVPGGGLYLVTFKGQLIKWKDLDDL